MVWLLIRISAATISKYGYCLTPSAEYEAAPGVDVVLMKNERKMEVCNE
jgi:hypothetical protein